MKPFHSLMALLLAATGASSEWALAKTPDRPAHHDPSGGFLNTYPTPSHGMPQFLKWRWQHWWGINHTEDQVELPPDPPGTTGDVEHPLEPFPLTPVDPACLAANTRHPTYTWIGHSTFLLQVDGVNLLADPYFSDRASPLTFMGPKRVVPPALAMDQLPPIHVVLISHNHYDHMDLAALRALNERAKTNTPGRQPILLVPLGVKAYLRGKGIFNVEEFDWWDSQVAGTEGYRAKGQTLAEKKSGSTIEAVFVPAQHFTARGAGDLNKTLWGGWVVKGKTFRFYYAGDTGYAPIFQDIGQRLGPFDLAAIPIGAYNPRWMMGPVHVNPEDAVKIHQDIRARQSVGVHWGTLSQTDEPLSEPPRRLVQARQTAGLAPDRFLVVRHGATLWSPEGPQGARPPLREGCPR
ncbi:MAG: MBL fold metallo-hydrolase [Deltaproteobacteria bacterium]|nr:MBL fold metallo-hydrolase [Deltaproteobacteria bacterium]MDH4122064.1 MBL fold metallo-hydrolase [Deltaproteobacteria bacterium]